MRKLERELSEAQEETRGALAKANETAEHLRDSKQEAERAWGEGKRNMGDFQKQVRGGASRVVDETAVAGLLISAPR